MYHPVETTDLEESTLDFLKVLSNNISILLVSSLERTFPTCSAPNLPFDFSTGDVNTR